MDGSFWFGIVLGCVAAWFGLNSLVRCRRGFPRTFMTAGAWMIAVASWLIAVHHLFLRTHKLPVSEIVVACITVLTLGGVSTLSAGLVLNRRQRGTPRHDGGVDAP